MLCVCCVCSLYVVCMLCVNMLHTLCACCVYVVYLLCVCKVYVTRMYCVYAHCLAGRCELFIYEKQYSAMVFSTVIVV